MRPCAPVRATKGSAQVPQPQCDSREHPVIRSASSIVLSWSRDDSRTHPWWTELGWKKRRASCCVVIVRLNRRSRQHPTGMRGGSRDYAGADSAILVTNSFLIQKPHEEVARVNHRVHRGHAGCARLPRCKIRQRGSDALTLGPLR